MNDRDWDFAAVRLRHVERRLLSEADIQRSPDRPLITSEAGRLAARQVLGDGQLKQTLASEMLGVVVPPPSENRMVLPEQIAKLQRAMCGIK